MLSDLLDRKQPQRRTVSLPLDPSMVERVEAARHAARVARVAASQSEEGGDDYEALKALVVEKEEDLAKAEDEWVANLAHFVFEGLGRRKFEALTVEHPPTREQRDRAKAVGGFASWNPDEFAPALISACLVEPKLSTAEVRELWDHPAWNQAELGELFEAAIFVCRDRQR